MKTIIAGTRTVTDPAIVVAAISSAPFPIPEIVSGCARGVNTIALRLGQQWGVPCRMFPAQWGLGNKAGPLRNQQMADYADALIAIWDGVSRGTADMINRAQAKGMSVHVHRYQEAFTQPLF